MARNHTYAIKKSKGERVFQVINYALLVTIALICLYPLLYVAFASVSDGNLLMQHTGILLKPQGFTLEAYKNVFKNPMILRGYLNTIFLLVTGVTFNIIMTSLGAYVLSRKGVFWNKLITLAVVFTMYFSGGMIPFYLTLKDLGMTNSLWGLIFPFLISTYNLIIMRTAFASVPEALVEAATLDGAGQFRILFSIMLPLIKATLAVMVLYYGVGIWNSWFWASAILRDRSLYPLQVVLREILLQNDVSSMMTGAATDQASVGATIKYATIMVATLPILAVYPFLQKYFAKGAMIGSVKG